MTPDPATAARVLARIVTPHAETPDTDYHEWITLGDRIKADRTGRLNARVWLEAWTEWRCNNPDCPGLAYVADDGIVHLIEEAEGSL